MAQAVRNGLCPLCLRVLLLLSGLWSCSILHACFSQPLLSTAVATSYHGLGVGFTSPRIRSQARYVAPSLGLIAWPPLAYTHALACACLRLLTLGICCLGYLHPAAPEEEDAPDSRNMFEQAAANAGVAMDVRYMHMLTMFWRSLHPGSRG